MYNMGTLLRSGSRAQKEKYLPDIAAGKLRLQSMAVTEPTTGTDTTKIKTTRREKGRPLRGQRPEGLDLAHPALDLMILLARTTPLAEVHEEVRGHVDLHRRPATGHRQRHDGAADPPTWSTTRPTSCSSTTWRSPPRT
jgi:acyl-CoA dehydrogenase